jgi:hypothetical protein
MLTLLIPTSGQNAVWWLRVTDSVIFSYEGATGVGAPAAGVDVGNVMTTVVPGVAVLTPFALRYAAAVADAIATGVVPG